MQTPKTDARTESMIANNPELKRARDISQGANPNTTGIISTASEAYKANYGNIDWSIKTETKPSFRMCVNGRYTDEE